ncbi:MAG TPA: SpoIIE family protein phosphatase [Acidimicrobiales bacterium]|nr:SpoIIE family protein phosphatase [Acidimicrobiales bacterium]
MSTEGLLPATAPDAALAPLRAVHRLTVSLHRAVSLEELYDEAVSLMVSTVGVDRASLLLFDAGGVMRFKAWRGISDGYRVAVEGHTPWGPDDVDATSLTVPDVAADPSLAGLLPVLREEGIAAAAFVPLLHGRRVVGKFMLYYDEPHQFGAAELAVAEILGGHVALALDRLRRETALQEAKAEAERAVARLARLGRVTSELSRALSADDVADVVLTTAQEVLGGRTASLCLVHGDELEVAYSVGYPDEVLRHWRRFPLDADLPASEAVRTGRPVFTRSPADLRKRWPAFARTPVIGSDAMAVIPLGDKPLGALVVGFDAAIVLTDQDESFFAELAARCAVALERARLFDERERSRARVALLAQVSDTLGASLDVEPVLGDVVRLLVPALADGCAVFLDGDHGLAPVAVHHDEPAVVDAVGSLCRVAGPELAAAVRSGAARTFASLAGQLAEGGVSSGIPADALGPAAVVPLVARRRVLGLLAVVNDVGRPLDDDSLSLVVEVAGRVAVAVENGRLFQERTAIAQTLQASLLPPRMPDIPGIELAARHVAAGAGVEVGGDFYDVFRVDARRFVVALGDVCGRGVGAASRAALCRHTIRSAVVTTLDPASILAHVNQVLVAASAPDVYEPRFCTAVVAVLTRHAGGASVELALGGHPPSLVRRADGRVEPLGVAGFLLGVSPDAEAEVARAELAEGDVLVCVTDGVLERRREADAFGESGLAAVLSAAGGDGAPALAEAVESAVVSFSEDEVGDDLAVLAVRVAPLGDAGSAGPPAGEVAVRLAGEPHNARAARVLVAATVAGWGLHQLTEPAVLLVSELAANVIVHAGSDMELLLRRTDAGLRVEVADTARRLPVRRPSDDLAPSGRGLMLVERLASRWGAHASAAGKVVWFELDGDPGDPAPYFGHRAATDAVV